MIIMWWLFLLTLSQLSRAQYTTDSNCFVRYPNQVAQCAYAFEHRNYVSEETCLALCLNNLPKCKSVVYHGHVNKCDLYNIAIPTQAASYPSPSPYPAPQTSYPAPGSYPVQQPSTRPQQQQATSYSARSARAAAENQGYFVPQVPARSSYPPQQNAYPRVQRELPQSFPQRRTVDPRQPQQFRGRLNNRGLIVPRRRKRNTIASRLRRVVPSPGAPQRVGNHYIFQPHSSSQYAPAPQPQTQSRFQSTLLSPSYVPRVIPPNAESRVAQQAYGPSLSSQQQNQYPPEVPQYYLFPAQQRQQQQVQAPQPQVERSQNYVAQPVGYPTNSQPSYIAVPLYPTPAPVTYPNVPATTITYHLIPGQGYPQPQHGAYPAPAAYPHPAPSYPAPAPHYPSPSYPAPSYPAPAPHYPAPAQNHDPCYGYGPRLGPNYGSTYFVPTGSCAEYEYAGLYAVWNNGVGTETTIAPLSTTVGTRYTVVFPANNNNQHSNSGYSNNAYQG